MTGRRYRFDWRETAARLEELATSFALRADERGRWVAPGLVCRVPGVLPSPAEGESPAAWLARLPPLPGTEVVLLLQAGAMACGLWIDDVLVDHKAQKRYVVRGSGKAQPTHLRTKGKSRYGSRLRLQNHERLLDDLLDRVRRWDEEHGPFDRVHHAVPVRLWDDLLDRDPPFARDDRALRPVPLDVHVPDHAELLRVRRELTRGTVEMDDPA